jgi:hypothetical protein
MFSADEIRSHLARLEREQIERDAENRETDEDEFQYESPARAAERIARGEDGFRVRGLLRDKPQGYGGLAEGSVDASADFRTRGIKTEPSMKRSARRTISL